MSRSSLVRLCQHVFVAVIAVAVVAGLSERHGAAQGRVKVTSAMVNPYRMLDNWPQWGSIKPGPAIGLAADGKGGLWLGQRADPAIVHIDASGKILTSFANGIFGRQHGLCIDRDGNIWAGDSGPNDDNVEQNSKAFVFRKFSPDGKLLMTVGKPGVSKAGTDTFVSPTNCTVMPNGDLLITDGHIQRSTKYAQQDGDRIVEITTAGKFVKQWGKSGVMPGDFIGPHGAAYDSQGRLFVADRSNNRVQIFDKDMNYIDSWRQFSRPSGVAILKDDTMFVSDSESSPNGFRPAESWEQFFLPPVPSPAPLVRNAGWAPGIRIGSAKDGSLKFYIPNTYPEGLEADEFGNVYAALTGGCNDVPTNPCLQKWVKK